MNKKKLERLERDETERESKARSESEDRQERIKVLWQELKKSLKESPDAAKELAKDELGATLQELVDFQKREIEYLRPFCQLLQRIRKRFPNELEKLSSDAILADAWEVASAWFAARPKPSPKQKHEAKRRRQFANGDVGIIEFEFGGAREAWLQKEVLLFNPFYSAPLPAPTCLDDILRGGVGEVKMLPSFAGQPPTAVDTVTNMRRLEVLFRMHRNRFPKKLPGRRMGREIVYNWRAVVEIMDALLSEKPGERKRSARGRPRRLWLSDRDLRNRVLSGIEARINSISVPKEIASEFLTRVRRHRADSAKK